MEEIPLSPTKELFSPLSPLKDQQVYNDPPQRKSRSNSINSLNGSIHGKVVSCTKIVKEEEEQGENLEKSLKVEKNKNEMLEKINNSLQMYIEEIEKKVEGRLENESRNYELQQKIEELAFQNEKLGECLNQSRSCNAEEIKALKMQLQNIENERFDLENQKLELESTNIEFFKEIEALRAGEKAAQNSISKVEEQKFQDSDGIRLESTLQELQQLRAKFREKDKEHFKCKELLHYYENQVPALKSTLETKDSQIQKLINQLDELSSEAKSLEERNNQLTQEITTLKTQRIEVSSMKKRREELMDEVSLNFSQFDEREKEESKALKELNLELCEQIERLKGRLLTKEKELEISKGESSTKGKNEGSKIQELEFRLRKKEEIITELQSRLKRIPFHDKSISQIPQMENVSCISEQFLAEKNRLVEDLSSVKTAKKSLKQELASAQRALEKCKDENAGLSKKLGKYKEEIGQWRNYYYSSYSQSERKSGNQSQVQNQKVVSCQPLQGYSTVQYQPKPQFMPLNIQKENIVGNTIPLYSNLLYNNSTVRSPLKSPTNYNRLTSPSRPPQYSLNALNESDYSMYETTSDERALISKYEV